MTVLILAVIIALVMIGLSVRANSRFRDESRLPMQWSLSVNWTAPRLVALSFTPALTMAILAFFVMGSMTMQPRPGQEGAVVPALLGMGVCFIAAHVFHLWMISKTLRRTEG